MRTDRREESARTVPIAVVSMLVGVLGLSTLFLTEPGYGYAIDEASYVYVAREERLWFAELPERGLSASLSAEGLARRWHFLEPPGGEASRHSNFNFPLSMHLLNVGWLVGSSFLDELTSYRLAPMALFSATMSAVCFVLARTLNLTAGLVGSLAMLATPRLFGHAHLAATETALGCFWVLTTLALLSLWNDRAGGRGVGIASWGATLSLSATMAVKLSGWFLAPAVGAWLLFARPTGWKRALVLSVLMPIPVIVALTPTLWHDPVGGLLRVLETSLRNPWLIPTYYLGEGYAGRLPTSSGLVTLAAVLPVTYVVAVLLSIGFGYRDGRFWAIALPIIAMLSASLARMLPTHDGDRHLVPVMLGVALLAGYAAGRLSDAVARRGWGRVIGAVVVGAAFLAEGAIDTWTYRMHGLCYYNRLVGGLRGAYEFGFEVSYWMETITDDQWRRLQEGLPQGTTIFLRPDHPGWADLVAWGVCRADLRLTGPEAEFYILSAKRAAYLLPGDAGDRLVPTDLGERSQWGPMSVEFGFQGVRLVGRCRRDDR